MVDVVVGAASGGCGGVEGPDTSGVGGGGPVLARVRGQAGRPLAAVAWRAWRRWSRWWARSAGGRRERLQACEGGGEFAGPGPVAVEAQDGLAGVEGESGGDVQQPV